jgi:hypothetical protein
MKVGDMIADNPGVWLLHCHVADHMMAGMYTTFTIGVPPSARVNPPTTNPGWMGFHDRATSRQ